MFKNLRVGLVAAAAMAATVLVPSAGQAAHAAPAQHAYATYHGRTIDLAVPEELAVLGADNDELLCNLATPPLSSVILNTHRTGYEAAALLDRLLTGQMVPSEVLRIAPLGIQTRQSTDTLAIDNRDVAAAVRFTGVIT